MAKPYRERETRPASIIEADGGVGISVLSTRIDSTVEKMMRLTTELDEEMILLIASEVGLDECIFYNEDMTGFVYDMTGLQLVSMCAALAAHIEYRKGASKRSKSREARSGTRSEKRAKQRKEGTRKSSDEEGISW